MAIALIRSVAGWLVCCLLCSGCLRFGYAPARRDQAGRSGTGGSGEVDAGDVRVPTDGGDLQMPTADAGSGDAGAYTNSMDAGSVLDASTGTPDAGDSTAQPPIPVDDAGAPIPVGDAGQQIPRMDAGSNMQMADAAMGDAAAASGDAAAPDAGIDAGAALSVCAAGQPLGGHCWFLGALGQSCNSACAAHGGYEPSLEWIGSYAQGGSRARCDALLTLLLGSGETTMRGTRSDGRGVGCHLFDATRWWLFDPNFKPYFWHPNARVVCSCVDK